MKKKSTVLKLPQVAFSKPFLKQLTFGLGTFVLGITSGVGLYHQIPESKQYFNFIGLKTHSSSSQENFERASFPTPSFVINRPGYTLVYDPRTRNASWVYEKLSSASLAGRITRDNFQFKEDTRIPAIFRSTLKDYQGSGFDRGHLAPAANHKSNPEAMSDTFFMSNMSPQVPQFNRGYWAQLEKHVRDLTKEYKTVEVFTGPLFLSEKDDQGKRWVKYQVIGENDVAVPTHFFKVIFLENDSGKRESHAYILPNASVSLNTPLNNFSTTIQKVEKAAGILLSK